jgi:hypothetical protein
MLQHRRSGLSSSTCSPWFQCAQFLSNFHSQNCACVSLSRPEKRLVVGKKDDLRAVAAQSPHGRAAPMMSHRQRFTDVWSNTDVGLALLYRHVQTLHLMCHIYIYIYVMYMYDSIVHMYTICNVYGKVMFIYVSSILSVCTVYHVYVMCICLWL